jgi:hypothetical protein
MKIIKKVNMACGDEMIPCAQVGPNLLVPEVLLDSPRLEEFVETAESILEAIPPESRDPWWVIGSTDRNLAGEIRVSKSHVDHLAFDMSPCYSETELVPPDRRIMGLAWNLLSLFTIAEAFSVCAVCAEGDHLHVMPDRDSTAQKFAVPTIATWYPLANTLQTLPAQVLLDKLFVLEGVSLRPATQDEFEAFMKAFSAGEAAK